MEDPEPERVPFNEREALEELERFRQDIERYRSQRKAVSEEFEQFIRSFEKPVEAPDRPAANLAPQPLTPRVEPAPKPPTHIESAPKPLNPSIEAAPDPGPLGAVPKPLPLDAETAPKPLPLDVETALKPLAPRVDAAPLPRSPVPPIPVPPARRPSGARTPMLLGALLLLVIGGWAAWTFWPGAPEPASVGQAPVTPAAVPPSAPAAPSPAPLTTELTTSRPVWVRVIADGERVVERELPSDARVPLKAQKTIVIRTGDAGAVRLTIAGQDQGPLGNAGEVVTRTFTIPPKPK